MQLPAEIKGEAVRLQRVGLVLLPEARIHVGNDGRLEPRTDENMTAVVAPHDRKLRVGIEPVFCAFRAPVARRVLLPQENGLAGSEQRSQVRVLENLGCGLHEPLPRCRHCVIRLPDSAASTVTRCRRIRCSSLRRDVENLWLVNA